MYALIMAGGSGTRLWPASRQKSPKQLLGFIGKKTLLQNTFSRLAKGFSSNHIFIATTKQYQAQIRKQLPKVPANHYSIEPALRDRGPAIGLAALLMHHADPDSSFVTAWSDHFIKDEAAYHQTLKVAEQFLSSHPEAFLTIGVRPTYPHTGFGYIEKGRDASAKKDGSIFAVRSFKEKPTPELAQKYFESPEYFWNSGYFICKTATLLELYKKHMPEVYDILMKIKPTVGTSKQQKAIDTFYPKMPNMDIEKGLIEKLDEIYMLPASFDWIDVGSWKVIKSVLSEEHENLVEGNAITLEAQSNLIYNYEDKLVALVGLDNIVVVNTKDALLIANKDDSEKIKELVKKLNEDRKLKKYL